MFVNIYFLFVILILTPSAVYRAVFFYNKCFDENKSFFSRQRKTGTRFKRVFRHEVHLRLSFFFSNYVDMAYCWREVRTVGTSLREQRTTREWFSSFRHTFMPSRIHVLLLLWTHFLRNIIVVVYRNERGENW